MSYLAQPTSKTEYGVVQVGNYIDVIDGIIDLSQDLSPEADVAFGSMSADTVYDNGDRVITDVSPSAGDGISITDVVSAGPAAGFTVSNTGVLSLIAGEGITISSSTGNITISSYGADLINVYGTTTNYTASLTDEYIGVNSASAVTSTLPEGIDGRVYIIKDERGQGSGKITIQPQAGEKIDNATTYIIGVPYQCVHTVFRAGNWWII